MAAATSAIDTPEKTDETNFYKLAASVVIYKGTIVSLNAAGFAIPGTDTASTKVVGIADDTVDNSTGIAGAKSAKVRRGVFKLKNSGIVQANIHANAVVVDNQTVASDSTNDIVAGRIEAIDTDGVWVRIY